MNNEIRALLLPFPVYGKGVGDGSRFTDTKLSGYRQNLYAGAKLPVKNRRRYEISIAIPRAKRAEGDRAQYFPTFGKY